MLNSSIIVVGSMRYSVHNANWIRSQ